MNAVWLVLCAVALAATAGLFVYVNDAWNTQGRGGRTLRVGVLCVFAVVTYGAGEAYVMHAPIGPRLPGLIVAFVVVLTGLWLIRRDQH